MSLRPDGWCLLALATPAAQAGTLWFNSASGTVWDDGSTADWSAIGPGSPSYTSVWTDGSDACFQGAAGTVSVGSIGSVNSITFSTDGYSLGGGAITLTGAGGNVTTGSGSDTIGSTITGSVGLTKLGTGTLILTNGGAFSGALNVNAATLLASWWNGNSSLTGVSIASGATLDMNGVTVWTPSRPRP